MTFPVHNVMVTIAICWIICLHGSFTCDLQLVDKNQTIVISDGIVSLSAWISDVTVQPTFEWSYVDSQGSIVSNNICKFSNNITSKCLLEWRDGDDIFLTYVIYVRVRIRDGKCENVTDVFNKKVVFSTPWELSKVSPTVYACITHGELDSVMKWIVVSNNSIYDTVLVDVAKCEATSAAFYDNITCDDSTSVIRLYIKINDAFHSELETYKIRCSNKVKVDKGSPFEDIGADPSDVPGRSTRNKSKTTQQLVTMNTSQWYRRGYVIYNVTGTGFLLVIIVTLCVAHRWRKRQQNEVYMENDIVNNVTYATPFRTTTHRQRTENDESTTPGNSNSMGTCRPSEDDCRERPYSVTVLETDSPNAMVGVISRGNLNSLATSQNPVLLHQPHYDMSHILSKENVYYTAAFDDEYAHLMRDTGRINSNDALIQENPYSTAVFDTTV